MRFRFVDRVISFEDGERPTLVTTKSFSRSDEFIEGHPQRPGEIPNCLILETLATAGAHLVYSCTAQQSVGLLLRVEEARIYFPVFPGEEVIVQTELLGLQPEAHESVGLARTNGFASVRSRKVAEARLVLLCFPKNGFEAAIPWQDLAKDI